MIVLVCFNFILKQTYRKPWMVGVISILCALFIIFTWRWAIEQSKSQLHDWLNNQQLMLDVAVVLSIEVVIQMAYCIMAVHLMNTGRVRRRTLVIYKLLRWFPGLLIFPVLFHVETICMQWLTRMDFAMIAYMLAVAVAIFVPAFVWCVRWLVPEKELRLEILFLSNALIALLGVIATVNGRTAVAGISEINLNALLGVMGLVTVLGVIGYGRHQLRIKS